MIMEQTKIKHMELTKELHYKVMKDIKKYVDRKNFIYNEDIASLDDVLYFNIKDSLNKYLKKSPYIDLGEEWKEYYEDLDIPKDWEENSYLNDQLPNFYHKEKKLKIWIDSKNVLVRTLNTLDMICSDCVKEIDEDTHVKLLKRFTIDRYDYDKDIGNGDRLLETNDFDEVVKFVNDYESK